MRYAGQTFGRRDTESLRFEKKKKTDVAGDARLCNVLVDEG